MDRQRLALRKALHLVLICSILGASAPAFADPAIAEKHYAAAQKAYQDGKFKEAARLLAKAHAEDPNLIYQYNRILALQAAGDYQSALDALEIYGAPMKRDKRFNADELTALDKKLRRQLADQKAKKDPVKDPKKDPVKDPKKDPVKDPVKDPGDPKPARSKTVPYVLLGVGGVSLLTGVVFATGAFAPDRPIDGAPTSEIDAYNSTIGTQKTVAGVGLGLGVVLMGVGGALLFMGGGEEEKAEGAMRVAPYVGPGQAGATFHLRF